MMSTRDELHGYAAIDDDEPWALPAPTLEDVALEAGVSASTASRVLNGSTRAVREHNRVRVLTAADRLGYVASFSAQAIARGQSAVVVLAVPDIADPLCANLAAGVGHAASESDNVLMVATVGGERSCAVAVARTIRRQRAGVVVIAESADVRLADEWWNEMQKAEDAGSRLIVVPLPPEGSEPKGGVSCLRDIGYAAVREVLA